MGVSENSKSGANIQDLKRKNQSLILKSIVLAQGLSRSQLASITGLSKMAVGNLVSDLIDAQLVEEFEAVFTGGSYGRNPVMLRLSRNSPCVCGMLIRRDLLQVVIADIGGHILRQKNMDMPGDADAEKIEKCLFDAYEMLRQDETRPVMAVGISSLGPLDEKQGTVLNPLNFHQIKDWRLVENMTQRTGLPVFLIHDASAGALAEKMYGPLKDVDDFMYLHIMGGIGCGYILDGKRYSGSTGQAGEIGHTSINCFGPRCECGNIGCLELYANLQQLRFHYAEAYFMINPRDAAAERRIAALDWSDIINSANQKEPAALAALAQYGDYIAHAVINCLNLLDLPCIVVGYSCESKGNVLESLLRSKITAYSHYKKVRVVHSSFGGDAPLIGAVACVAEHIFDQSIPLLADKKEKDEDIQ
jgi:transcriptional regulator of PTS gene